MKVCAAHTLFFNFCAVLTIFVSCFTSPNFVVPTYQIIEFIFLLFLMKWFIFYPVAVTFFSSEIIMRLFIFKNISPPPGISTIHPLIQYSCSCLCMLCAGQCYGMRTLWCISMSITIRFKLYLMMVEDVIL